MARRKGVKCYLNPRGLKTLDALDRIPDRYSTTSASIALGWLIGCPGITAPIGSATSLRQLEQLVKAASVALAEQAISELDDASAYKKD